jgi:hypothetical protein
MYSAVILATALPPWRDETVWVIRGETGDEKR